MTGEIREVDTHTAPEAVLFQVTGVRRARLALVAPDEPVEADDVAVAQLRHPHGDTRQDLWVAGEPAHAYLLLSSEADNPAGYIKLFVGPQHGRRGIGRALLDLAFARARELGLTTLTGTHVDAGGAAFAAAVGARTGKTTVRSVLTMPARPVEPKADAYRTRSWVGPAPDELLASYVAARYAINDAPWDEGVPKQEFSAERIRDHERTVERRGGQVRVTVAIDGGGEVAGFTEVVVRPEADSLASTEDTAVLAAHRGRGVATLVKAESLRLLGADRPDIARVSTFNAASNAAMLAVNRRLGFEPVSRWTSAMLSVR